MSLSGRVTPRVSGKTPSPHHPDGHFEGGVPEGGQTEEETRSEAEEAFRAGEASVAEGSAQVVADSLPSTCEFGGSTAAALTAEVAKK